MDCGCEIKEHKPYEERTDGKYDDWELDEAIRTLKRAEQIKSNGTLLTAIQKRLKGEQQVIRSIAELRKVANDKADEPEDEDQ